MTGSTLKSLAWVAALTAALGAARAEEGPVSLREPDRGSYEITGEFTAAVPRPAAWAVLTDYEHIEDFVSAVTLSRVVERGEDGATVEQKSVANALFFSRRMVLWLRVRETPPGEISFEDLSRRDFESYRGRWTLEEAAGGCRVAYRLEARPKFAAPGWMTRSALRKSARRLLEEVRREMLRRVEKGVLGTLHVDGPDAPDVYREVK